MQIRWMTAIAAALLGCGADESNAPEIERAGVHQARTILFGRVVGLAPDSELVAIRAATVEIFLVGDVPPDTGDSAGPPSPPPPPPDSGLVRFSLRVQLLDSIPPDTVPPDTVTPPPPDTVTPPPPDTVIPPPPDTVPPPPTSVCGQRGELVATVTTDRTGRFRVAGLEPGLYDIRATPRPRSRFGTALACGVELNGGEPTHIRLFAPPIVDSLTQ